jgi:formimidoylglutamate deiminase
MYNLAATLNEQSLYELSKQAFTEMLRSGITTVGEFHYLHHSKPFDD